VTPKPKSIREFFISWYFWKPLIGVVSGFLLGFLYYYFIECKTDTCIFGKDMLSTVLFGGLLGLFLTSSPCFRFGKK
jgi:hypothetical protein